MKKIKIIFIILLLNQVKSQNCTSNEKTLDDYCCGRDPEFYIIPYQNDEVHRMLYGNAFPSTYSDGNGFCKSKYYDFIKLSSYSSILGDWMVVWEDDFNYGVFDESFYRNSLPWQNYDEGFKNSVDDPSAIKLNNGKLILQGYYDPDPNKKYLYYGKNIDDPSTECYPCGFRHFDYVTGNISTKFMFPINVRYQASIKAHDNAESIWSAFWLFGHHDPSLPACPTLTLFPIIPLSPTIQTIRYTEIDIFEIRKNNESYYSENNPNHTLFMTYHNTKYGDCGLRRHEGVVRYTGTNLTGGFHQYDLIWDHWKIQWWLDGNIIHSVNKYYNMKNYWGESLRKKNFRRIPINSYNDLVNINGEKKVAFNVHFPYNNVPMRILFGFAPNKIDNTNTYLIHPNSVGPGYSQQMDWLKVWVRADCNKTNNVGSLNYLYKDNMEGYIIETGRIIKTNSGTNLVLDWPSAYSAGWGITSAIFAATEEIEFNDGFGVENGNLFAFPTYCQTSWDSRMMNENNINDDLTTMMDEENDPELKMDEINVMNNNMDLRIYPNPSDGIIYIKDFSSKINYVEIYDVFNKMVYKSNVNEEIKIELNNIENGVYLMKFYSNC
ncbi:MAG: T9SS type A sorting domain-containing protein [Thermoplasmata archaeon]